MMIDEILKSLISESAPLALLGFLIWQQNRVMARIYVRLLDMMESLIECVKIIEQIGKAHAENLGDR